MLKLHNINKTVENNKSTLKGFMKWNPTIKIETTIIIPENKRENFFHAHCIHFVLLYFDFICIYKVFDEILVLVASVLKKVVFPKL